MRRFVLALSISCAVVLTLFGLPHLVYALQDSTAVIDRTGLFGPILDKAWPVIVTFLTSLTVKIVAKINEGFAKSGDLVKWAVLYAFALLYNWAGAKLGWAPVDALAPVFGLALLQTGAAAVIYKFGGHKVPAVESAETLRGSPLR